MRERGVIGSAVPVHLVRFYIHDSSRRNGYFFAFGSDNPFALGNVQHLAAGVSVKLVFSAAVELNQGDLNLLTRVGAFENKLQICFSPVEPFPVRFLGLTLVRVNSCRFRLGSRPSTVCLRRDVVEALLCISSPSFVLICADSWLDIFSVLSEPLS